MRKDADGRFFHDTFTDVDRNPITPVLIAQLGPLKERLINERE